MKFFEDLIILENELEKQRRTKLTQINIKDLFRCIDQEMKGYATFEDYTRFFQDCYKHEIPISNEEITYLYRRHCRVDESHVTEIAFLKELLPLEEFVLI